MSEDLERCVENLDPAHRGLIEEGVTVRTRIPYRVTPGATYCQRDVQVRFRTPQARVLRNVLQGLMDQGAEEGGEPVSTPQGALRWLLEHVDAKAVEQIVAASKGKGSKQTAKAGS